MTAPELDDAWFDKADLLDSRKLIRRAPTPEPALTFRDQAMLAALTGLCASEAAWGPILQGSPGALANWALRTADALCALVGRGDVNA